MLVVIFIIIYSGYPFNFFSFSFSLPDSKQYFVVSPLVLFYNMYFFMEQTSWRDNIGFSTLDTIPFLVFCRIDAGTSNKKECVVDK